MPCIVSLPPECCEGVHIMKKNIFIIEKKILMETFDSCSNQTYQ